MAYLLLFAMIVSFYGYQVHLVRIFNIHARTSLLTAVSLISSVLYFLALVNMLNWGAIILYVLGILLYLFYAIKERSVLFFEMKYADWMLVLIVIIISVALVQSHLVHYDNFSHWAKIVKFLNLNHRLPNATDTIIEFTSYPVGTAVFVYYFTRFTTFNEGFMLLGQFMVCIAAFQTLSLNIRDERRFLPQAILFIFIVLSMTYGVSIGLNNLLVDYVMPLVGISLISSLIYHKRDFRASTLLLVTHTLFLIIIKNSAVYFAFGGIIVYLFNTYKYSKSFNHFIKATSSVVVSFLSLITWNMHVNATFSEASKHGLDVGSYESILAQKSPENIQSIFDAFLDRSLNITTFTTQGILLALCLCALLGVVLWVLKRSKPVIFGLLGALIVYVFLYFVGIFAMFIISMPLDEALVLAGYDRYAASMSVFVLIAVGLVFQYYVDYLLYQQNVSMRDYRSYYSITSKRFYQYTTLVLIFASAVLFFAQNHILMQDVKHYQNTLAQKVESLNLDSKGFKPSDKILVVSSDDEGQISSYYVQNMVSYYSWVPEVTALDRYYTYDYAAFSNMLEQFDYIVYVEQNLSFDDQIKDHYGIKLNHGIIAVSDLING